MYVTKARTAIVEDLEKKGFLKSTKQITHNTNTHDRCGTEIEFMKTAQWFIKVMEHKEKLIALGDEIEWHPKHMQTRYTNWVENLGWDWGISRQRHFGIPFPLWYEKDTGNIIVAKPEDLPIDPLESTPSWYPHPENLIPETDVMDTWATSSVTPQIALDWKGEAQPTNIPMSIRMQAHDIIRTWAFYTIVKSYHHHNTVPWKHIMVSGFVLDPKGKKMSKSKGNTIDPIALVEKNGADAVRYGASSVKLGEDLPFQEKYIDTGRKLVTKIFNASKFAHLHLEDFKGGFDATLLTPIDNYLLAQLSTMQQQANKYLTTYEFAKARQEIELRFWMFCDYYLEIVKDRLYKPEIHGDESRTAAQMTLAKALEMLLTSFAPYVPFVTEEVWSWHLAGLHKSTSVHTHQWKLEQFTASEELTLGAETLLQLISLGRQKKNSEGMSQRAQITSMTITCTHETQEAIKLFESDLKRTLSIETVQYSDGEELEVEIILAPAEEKE
jgi:valyl-tRNA synthetase